MVKVGLDIQAIKDFCFLTKKQKTRRSRDLNTIGYCNLRLLAAMKIVMINDDYLPEKSTII